MGQAKVEGENRAIEAVVQALDSPLLNDNDITGAKQVLLKIVTGDGEGEIKMSELAKIKNKIQQAAGTNVNIIEGIGIDPELGLSISVTVIATGFEEKRKPKKKTVIDLNQNIEKINNSDLESKEIDELTSEKELGYQISLLENENDFNLDSVKNDEPNEILNDQINNGIENDNLTKNQLLKEEESLEINNKIVLDLSDTIDNIDTDINNSLDLENCMPENKIKKEENKPEEILKVESKDNDTSIKKDQGQNQDEKIILKLDENEEIQNENKIETIENLEVNSDAMKVQAREREERLRTISMQLRTPSGLTSLEDVPAYKRNNIELTSISHSSKSEISSFTLDSKNEKKTELRQDNSFLHDNID